MISPQDRRQAVELIDEAIGNGAGLVRACEALGICPKTYHAWKADPTGEDGRTKAARATQERKPSPRALSEEERQELVSRYCQPDVRDLSIPQAFYTLLDNREYYGSLRTVYRVMKDANLNAQRTSTRSPQKRSKPTSYLATGPNQVWTWDITYLRDATCSGRFFYAYAIIDIFSRVIVHHAVYPADNSEYAEKFLGEAFKRHHIKPRALVLHSDNGASMKAANVRALLSNEGIEFSHSRPRVSDDNPYSEAFFRTLKYTGEVRYPKGGFESIDAANAWLTEYVDTYNGSRYHSGINYVTPNARFTGEDKVILAARRQCIEAAKERHPERWIQGKVMNCEPVGGVWLNPDKEPDAS